MNGKSSVKRHYLWVALSSLDLLGLLAAFLFSYWIRIYSGIIPYFSDAPFPDYVMLYLYSIPFLILIFQQNRLYDHHELFYGTGEFVQIIKGVTFYILSVIVLSFVIRTAPPSRGWLIGTWIFSIVFISAGRIFLRVCLKRIWKNGDSLDRVIIIGANEEAKAIAEQIDNKGMVDVVGFLDEFSFQGEKVWNEKTILGPPTRYIEISKREGANLVILVPDAISWESQREILGNASNQKDVEIQIAPGFSELYLTSMRVCFKGNVPLLRFYPGYITGLDALQKMVMDYTLGVLFLVLAVPVILLSSMILFLEGKKPVIKGFKVLGKNGEVFETYKFRTGADVPTSYRSFRNRAKDSARLAEEMTPFGGFLFQTTLDKLPQLFNVIMGKMSLVGPRVVPVDSAKRYGPWLASILAVKPGMTGAWAFQKYNDLEQEISLTLYYVRNWSIHKDLLLMAQTFFEMLRTRFRTRLLETVEQAD
ncbi:sugar transferase [bacterium]|nr:sugar transferase [bacterium]